MINDSTLGALAGIIAVVGIIAFVWIIIDIVAGWKIFTKAGEAGWKSIIPYYNTYTQLGFTWNINVFWVYLVITIASAILQRMQGGGFVSLLQFVVGIASIVLSIMMLNKLAKAFGKGTGFTVGLVLLNPIFMCILAFGSAEYQGIPD